MTTDIQTYNDSLSGTEKEICELLFKEINKQMPEQESKVWHAHPVWFLDGNPIVGYSKRKAGIQLMFWSGADFGEENLKPGTGKFKDASITYTDVDQIDTEDLERWLEKGKKIQWDYKHIVKNKGKLNKLTEA
ncbi:MAG: DUF1801 domain-containing protein [Weeksellaceae bacterium]